MDPSGASVYLALPVTMLDRLFRKLREDRRRPSVPLVLYTRPDCGLCEEMKAEIGRARLCAPYTIQEVDISGDSELEARYGESIPVLHVAGRLAFEGRLSAPELEAKFARIVAQAGAEGS
jgi:hypothetical protein